MSRRPTRQLTWPFVLRTFKRLSMIAARYDAETMAKALVENRVSMDGADTFLSDIGDYMRTLDHDFYCSGRLPKHDKCLVCDEKIDLDHNGARYCSRECRQRAYRVRKAAAEGRNSPIPKRARTTPSRKEAALKAAMDTMARQKEALAFANSMYALHLKAHPDEENCSASHLEDTSPNAESETNVTRIGVPS